MVETTEQSEPGGNEEENTDIKPLYCVDTIGLVCDLVIRTAVAAGRWHRPFGSGFVAQVGSVT